MHDRDDENRIYRTIDLIELGYGCRTTLWRKIKSGEFPAPIQINGRPGWFGSTISKYRESLLNQ